MTSTLCARRTRSVPLWAVRAIRLVGLLAVCAFVFAASTTGSGGAVPQRPLYTGVIDPFAFTAPTAPAAFARARAAGTTLVRLAIDWSSVVGNGHRPPKHFDATDPADPHYNWSGYDTQIRLAEKNHLEPIV